jgi:hypothetical protein
MGSGIAIRAAHRGNCWRASCTAWIKCGSVRDLNVGSLAGKRFEKECMGLQLVESLDRILDP